MIAVLQILGVVIYFQPNMFLIIYFEYFLNNFDKDDIIILFN